MSVYPNEQAIRIFLDGTNTSSACTFRVYYLYFLKLFCLVDTIFYFIYLTFLFHKGIKMNPQKILLAAVTGVVFLFSKSGYSAEEQKFTALEIMKKVSETNMTMDQRSTVTMQLIDAQGNKRKIVTLRLHKHYAGKDQFETKSVFYTEFPPDQKGTGFLIWDYAIEGKPDDLWLYLPSLRSVRRMTTRDQHDSFMGSDLTFADMGARRLDEDVHVLVFEGVCRGVEEPCYVVESTPKEKESPYGKKRFFISQKDWVARRIEFFDRNMKPLKLQSIVWQKIGEVLAWKHSEVINVQSNHQTIFDISDVKNNTGLGDEDFTERMLVRGAQRR